MRQRFVSSGRVIAYLDSHASVAAPDGTRAAPDFSPAHTLVALHRFLLSYATFDWRVNDINSRRQASNR